MKIKITKKAYIKTALTHLLLLIFLPFLIFITIGILDFPEVPDLNGRTLTNRGAGPFSCGIGETDKEVIIHHCDFLGIVKLSLFFEALIYFGLFSNLILEPKLIGFIIIIVNIMIFFGIGKLFSFLEHRKQI